MSVPSPGAQTQSLQTDTPCRCVGASCLLVTLYYAISNPAHKTCHLNYRSLARSLAQEEWQVFVLLCRLGKLRQFYSHTQNTLFCSRWIEAVNHGNLDDVTTSFITKTRRPGVNCERLVCRQTSFTIWTNYQRQVDSPDNYTTNITSIPLTMIRWVEHIARLDCTALNDGSEKSIWKELVRR